jgi:Transposase Tn5 dimerisation domain
LICNICSFVLSTRFPEIILLTAKAPQLCNKAVMKTRETTIAVPLTVTDYGTIRIADSRESGCRIEDCLLETAARLKRYLAGMSVIAWRLFWLTHMNRQNPEANCIQILAQREWQALYCRINKTTQLPKKPPTVRQAIRWIAQLGGF